MKGFFRKQGGFTLIEVVAAIGLIAIMATMLMPSLSGVGIKAKNAKLKNDFAIIDQAMQLYILDNGTYTTDLTKLHGKYISGKPDFEDASGATITVVANDDGTYSLQGKDAAGKTVTYPYDEAKGE